MFTPTSFYTGFEPNSVDGLILWFDAQEGITESSGDVSQWVDRSDNGFYATQSTAGNQPFLSESIAQINGKNAVRFENASSNFMDIVDVTGSSKPWVETSLDNSHTIFVVTKQYTTTTNHYGVYITQGDNARRSVGWGPQTFPNNYISWGTDNYASGGFRVSGSSTTGPFTAQKWYTGVVSWKNWEDAQANATSGSIRVNGEEYTTETWNSAPATPTTTNPRLGRFIDTSTTAHLNADMAELIVYTGSLETSDIEKIENYLRVKYARY